MIELFDDFRDILVELHNAGARFVVLGGHAVAFHGRPRATKDLDVLVEANSNNAKRVYAALAAFGAPLSAFEVGVEDFASYDGLWDQHVVPEQRGEAGGKLGMIHGDCCAPMSGAVAGRAVPKKSLPPLFC